jgi:hypothetical protein
MPRDFRKAREKAKKAGRKAVGNKLEEINEQADELEGIFDALKLTDQETYDELVKIVKEATAKNESVASVIARVKELGAAGVKLAGTIADISSGGTLAALRGALKL